jgi:hypothetical protein
MFEDAMAAAVAAGVAEVAPRAGETARRAGSVPDGGRGGLANDADASSEDSPDRVPASLPAALAAHSRNVSGDGSDDETAKLAEAKLAGLESVGKKKGRCCVASCAKRWDKWMSTSGFRMKPAKHYCGLCQRAYCVAHTATSPHGAKGRCDPESKCVCVVCYQSLDEHARDELEATNKLPRAASLGETQPLTPSSRARSRWQSVKQYQLRTSDSTNLPLSPATSSGNLRAFASPNSRRG